jgi:hypothetical protein
MAKTYDAACYELAALFLSDSPAMNNEFHRDELATYIQSEIEGWLEYEEKHGTGPRVPVGG